MKLGIKIAALISLVGLVGCVSTEHKINAVSLGMNKQQVIEALGTPDNSRAAEGVEYMIYQLKAATDAGFCAASILAFGAGCARDKVDYFVQLEQGKVTAYGKVGDFDSIKDPEATININKTVKEIE